MAQWSKIAKKKIRSDVLHLIEPRTEPSPDTEPKKRPQWMSDLNAKVPKKEASPTQIHEKEK